MNVCDLSGYVLPRLDDASPTRKNRRIMPPEKSGLGITPDMSLLGEPFLVVE